jgi:hypothetical protein
MKKKSLLVELIFKKPCKKCLVQPCCEKGCDDLDKWYEKYDVLIVLNDLIMLLLGTICLLFLGALTMSKILRMDKAVMIADKIEKLVEKNINR